MKRVITILLSAALLMSMAACGGTDAPEPTPSAEIEATPEPTAEPTDEAYIMNSTYLVGTFSNSATTNSNLYANLLIDEENLAIMLLEYGRNVVKNSGRYDEYDITMKKADGTTVEIKGWIWSGGDRIVIDDVYKAMAG